MESTSTLTPPQDLPEEPLQMLPAQLAALAAENDRLVLHVRMLEAQLEARAVAREAVTADPNALSLFADPTEQKSPVAGLADSSSVATARPMGAAPAPRRSPGRQPLDPARPREVIPVPDPPEVERVCAETGAPLERGFTQALEVLARKPAVYYVRRYERTVWVSPAKTAPVVTPSPADVLSRSGVHASLVAHIAAAHFSEHVP